MGEVVEDRRDEFVRLRLQVSGFPDVPQTRSPGHADIVPDRVTVEYRRQAGFASASWDWACIVLEVHGNKRLRNGGVGNHRDSATYRTRMGLVDWPEEEWPGWLRELVEERRPGT